MTDKSRKRDDGNPLDEMELPFTVPVGSAQITLGELLALGPGATLALDGEADAPVPIVVNGLPVATGKLVLVDGDFAVKVETVEAGAGQTVLDRSENTEGADPVQVSDTAGAADARDANSPDETQEVQS